MPVQGTWPPSVPSTTVCGRVKEPVRGLGRRKQPEDAVSSLSWRQAEEAFGIVCHAAASFGFGSRVGATGGRNSAARRRFLKQPGAKNISALPCSGNADRTKKNSPWKLSPVVIVVGLFVPNFSVLNGATHAAG
ncbi:uncharacterized protein LOC144100581 isoform X1 [Amblyomma americanum]